jgi:D-alanyl-D-alanine dipeptidase
MIRSMKGFTFASSLDLNMGYYHIKSHQTRCLYSKGMYNCIPMAHRKIQTQTLTYGYQDCLVPDVFQNVMSKLVHDMEYVKSKMLS